METGLPRCDEGEIPGFARCLPCATLTHGSASARECSVRVVRRRTAAAPLAGAVVHELHGRAFDRFDDEPAAEPVSLLDRDPRVVTRNIDGLNRIGRAILTRPVPKAHLAMACDEDLDGATFGRDDDAAWFRSEHEPERVGREPRGFDGATLRGAPECLAGV